MKYGLIGNPLSQSFSPLIHEALGSAPYELHPLSPEELEPFLLEHNFLGINVTIPYKQAVLPYLSEIDAASARIGAVNTILVRPDGSLAGYNTDYDGMKYALKHAGIDPAGKKALILGSGGTSRTARTLLHDLGASEIVIVSRRKATALALPEAPETAASHSVLMKTQADSGSASGIEKAPADSGCASTASETSKSDSFGTHEEIPVTMTDYEHVRIDHADAQIIINTTPVGMTPGNGRTPLDLTSFKDLCGVADVIYNPLRTAFIMQAEELGIPCTGGLLMLVAQAKAAAEYFLERKIPDSEIDLIYRDRSEERRVGKECRSRWSPYH